MRNLKRILSFLLFLFLLVVSTLFVIALAYEKEVKEYVIKQLNGRLKTKVIIDSENIDFSLLKNFPYASLDFKNIIMLESPVGRNKPDKNGKKQFMKTDTLFSSEHIFLQFNIWDILITKNYVIKKISAKNGFVKLRSGMDGSVNWDVWKEDTSTTATSPEESVFNLKKLQLDNIILSYRDYRNKTDITGKVHKAVLGGEFASQKYDLSVKGELQVSHFNMDSVNYINNKPVKLDLNLTVDNSADSYQFTDAFLQVSDLKIAVVGKYVNSSPSGWIDVSLKGEDMEIQSVLSILPEKYHQHISDYESDGEFYCNARISGKIDEANSPEVKADFGITKADITQLSSGIVLKEVHLLGKYFTSSVKDFLDIKTFSAGLQNGRLSGSIRMDNLSSPYVTASIQANLLLEDVRHLLKVDSIWNYPLESLSGVIKGNMEYKGHLNATGKYHKADFDNMNLAGDMTLENAGMKIKNSSLLFDSINGSFIMNDNDIEVSSFSGKTPKSDFYLKGFMKNILAYTFTDNADINIDAVFQSNNLDMNELLLDQGESSKRDTVYRISFSPNLNFILNSEVEHFTFRRFEANRLKGGFSLRNQKLIVDPVSFETMDGKVSASGMIDATKKDTLLITCDANFTKLNINKLFFQFEDFGQEIITHNNLRGIGTASVQFASIWKSDLSVDPNKIYARSNMTIEKGELLNFEPMNSLAKYISVAELKDIKFSTLQNQIEIKDQKIFIPKMDIQSSALNITLSGSHSFNNDLDYHFRVLMSDILFQKARKAKKENDEFGIVEEDNAGKTSLFISMTGTVEDPIIKYDRQGAKQSRKQNISEEKQTLRQILKEEFGWFRKDTLRNKKENPKDGGKFIIKWDEDEKKDKGQQEADDF